MGEEGVNGSGELRTGGGVPVLCSVLPSVEQRSTGEQPGRIRQEKGSQSGQGGAFIRSWPNLHFHHSGSAAGGSGPPSSVPLLLLSNEQRLLPPHSSDFPLTLPFTPGQPERRLRPAPSGSTLSL
ncbi:hypothetical protein SKAU_G00151400 [Synaphobranchus kaupii]|uniref:Uncharacterized protein n=1 Tax=Synaphobranchus kaupii TaxID=118154 RepID=A0A9Q1FGR0_SYNKA|nr:hypothetical protein SKAU_G00151400 [Synaphobranchus kaupii]